MSEGVFDVLVSGHRHSSCPCGEMLRGGEVVFIRGSGGTGYAECLSCAEKRGHTSIPVEIVQQSALAIRIDERARRELAAEHDRTIVYRVKAEGMPGLREQIERWVADAIEAKVNTPLASHDHGA